MQKVAGTEVLQEMLNAAEDAELEVYVEWHPSFDVIEYIEIDGKEYYNSDYVDEVQDAHWQADAYEAAEGAWRE